MCIRGHLCRNKFFVVSRTLYVDFILRKLINCPSIAMHVEWHNVKTYAKYTYKIYAKIAFCPSWTWTQSIGTYQRFAIKEIRIMRTEMFLNYMYVVYHNVLGNWRRASRITNFFFSFVVCSTLERTIKTKIETNTRKQRRGLRAIRLYAYQTINESMNIM